MFRKVSQHSRLFTDLKNVMHTHWLPGFACLHSIDQCGVLSQPVASADGVYDSLNPKQQVSWAKD